MTSTNCNYNCLLEPYFDIFTDLDDGGPLSQTEICSALDHSLRARSPSSLYKTATSYPPGFVSSTGLLGSHLLDWNDGAHQSGLVEMTHEFLCLRQKGSLYWPDGGDLRYSRDRNEIYSYMISLFFKINEKESAKRYKEVNLQRSDAPEPSSQNQSLWHHGNFPDDPIDIDSHMLPAPDQEHFIQGDEDASMKDELIRPVAQETTAMGDITLQQRSANQNETPDPISLVIGTPEPEPSLLNAQTRRVTRRWNPQDRLTKFIPHPASSQQRAASEPPHSQEHGDGRNLGETAGGSSRPAPTFLMSGALGGMPFAPEGSQNTESQAPHDQAALGFDNRRFIPFHDVPRASSEPRTRSSRDPSAETYREGEDRSMSESKSSSPLPSTFPLTPMAEHDIPLIFSIDAYPGFNIRWSFVDFFQYSLARLLEEMPWECHFDSVLMFLEAPGKVTAERIRKDNEREFQIALKRFAQKVETLRQWHAGCDRVVLEIYLEPSLGGQSHNERLQALLRTSKVEG
ncbi:hypothetical protein FZEAL_157 [Fusarium zealandicum]|uniref:Uncharacterized protein n=1 Tax=Fusarium zealandicum TaxID=1053134 RepID=A0A8H4UVF8_9HYPO|nr:hypothetical protein FZEAL_157 [Fusarium zealandicum]